MNFLTVGDRQTALCDREMITILKELLGGIGLQ
jgi:hypothetical protein